MNVFLCYLSHPISISGDFQNSSPLSRPHVTNQPPQWAGENFLLLRTEELRITKELNEIYPYLIPQLLPFCRFPVLTEFKSDYEALWVMNYFPPYKIFPTDERFDSLSLLDN